MIRHSVIGAVMVALSGQVTVAHEYYLMPDRFLAVAGEEVAISHRLGQNFKGNEMSYIDAWNIRSEVWENGRMRQVSGLDGDRPALTIVPHGEGLLAVIHQSNIDLLTFKTWEKFRNYATKEGLEHALQASQEGIKPKEGLKEAYARYAKTLISVGNNPSGNDQATGMKIELVALAHPLALTEGQAMPVQLLFDGKPLAGAKVKVFVGEGTEFRHQIRTNSEGEVMIAADGPGPYLLNAIAMTEPQSEKAVQSEAHWESFWASLTFERAR